MSDKEGIKKYGGSVLSDVMYSNYTHSFMRATSPLLDYGVEYDIEEMVWSKGEYVKAIYGKTEKEERMWRVRVGRNGDSVVAGMNDDDFMLCNGMAFYQIHATQFRNNGATKKDMMMATRWFLHYVVAWNKEIGIEIKSKGYNGKEWDQDILDIVWERRKIEDGSSNWNYFRPFFIMTDTFPGNEVGRKALLYHRARVFLHQSIDYTREAMGFNESHISSEVVSEFNSEVMEPTIKQTTKLLTSHKVEDYFVNNLGMTRQDREDARVGYVMITYNPKDVGELANYLDESIYVTKGMLVRGGIHTPKSIKQGWLLGIARTCNNKTELLEKSGLNRSTVTRKIKKSTKLRNIWKKL